MPIEGATLWDAVREFCDYLNRLLAKTVTERRLVPIGRRESPRIQITFRESTGGQPARARLHTTFGPMDLYIGQVCEGVLTAGRYRLITTAYKYTLAEADQDEPRFRWEYVRHPPAGQVWCRHHLQGNVPLQLVGAVLSLNDLHLPTGYVPIEEVLRFCIVDLGVRAQSEDWHSILEESYRRFRRELAGPPPE